MYDSFLLPPPPPPSLLSSPSFRPAMGVDHEKSRVAAARELAYV